MPEYSIIVPVYNRPAEVSELLASLCVCDGIGNAEVIIVEDGSSVSSETVVSGYTDRLDIRYLRKDNSGPGPSRNYGAERASGKWLIILDSDVSLPEGYLKAVSEGIAQTGADAFGGPDMARDDFSPVQKAIDYAMTSFLTTGGIRGGKARLDKFFPRSFNMGMRREVFKELGGFSPMRFGEDIDLSYRLFDAGYKAVLLPGAAVWHRRRTDLRKFFRQVHNSGIARIDLTLRHPGTLKIVHVLPAAFTAGCAILLAATPFVPWASLPIVLYAVLLFADSFFRLKRGVRGMAPAGVGDSVKTALLSVVASFVQLTGYGSGFIRAFIRRIMFRGRSFQAFEKTFYK